MYIYIYMYMCVYIYIYIYIYMIYKSHIYLSMYTEYTCVNIRMYAYVPDKSINPYTYTNVYRTWWMWTTTE